MFFDTLDSEEKVSYLIKPILLVLQEAGGRLDRSEIRERICDMDEHIAEFEQKIYTSKKTGNQYKKFDFKFNFAIKELEFVKLINYTKYNPQITLTQAGLSLNVSQLDVELDVRDKAKAYWEETSAKRKIKNSIISDPEADDEEADADVIDNDPVDDFKTKLQEAINNMSPAKFEQFSRALLTEMGVKFTEKSIKISNDGGIDGYGFITNNLFTEQARQAAAEGKPITLIDGSELIKLVMKYELYITPVKTYLLDDFYLDV